jgi:heme O synthase-like polyprenyltransferase
MINSMLILFSQISIPGGDIKIPKTDLPENAQEFIVLNIVFGVIAAVAVLVIVIAGLQFILSRGEPQKTATARNTIIYASIGLALAFFAFAIVRFVLGEL